MNLIDVLNSNDWVLATFISAMLAGFGFVIWFIIYYMKKL